MYSFRPESDDLLRCFQPHGLRDNSDVCPLRECSSVRSRVVKIAAKWRVTAREKTNNTVGNMFRFMVVVVDIALRAAYTVVIIKQILNRLYEVENHVNSEQQVNEAIQHIVNRNSMQYEALVGFLTDNQMSLLKAIAKKDRVTSPQSNEFIKQYDLPSASSVKTALTVLLDKDMIYRDATGYWVYDRFFDLWLKQLI